MTSTCIVTAKLDPSAQDEKLLNDRLYAAYRMQRKLTHHAVTSLHALKQDGTYRGLLLLYRESKQ